MIAAKRKQIRLHGQSTAKNRDSFALEIRIRGRTDFLHQEVCGGLEDAIRIGEKWFCAFQKRDPWFVQDSKDRKIIILLDSEVPVVGFDMPVLHRAAGFDIAQV